MPNIALWIESAGGGLNLLQTDAEPGSKAFESARATMLQRGRLPQSRHRRTETVPGAPTKPIRKT
ncbi:hypothetical protein [Paraburkholderia sp. RL17-347-BIC-D]|uniref:hypothetical protein n=1 Tax=Paraburkholderia sp. RL17-347-BIC-D TaxID=3031632 RepID=UPI0038BA5BFA